MKFLLSSSVSSCSSSLSKTASAGSGCLAGVFRNPFCSASLPAYPSDQPADESDTLNSIAAGNTENNSAPGVVARLMGLDSLPEIDVDQAQSDLILLSRSMNSVDYLCERSGSQHRRVKSTLPSLEFPIFLTSENEDFLVLSFGNVKESKEFRRRRRNSKSKERRREKLPEKKKEEGPEKLSRRISAESTIRRKDLCGISKHAENSSIDIHHEQIPGDRKVRTKATINYDGIKMEEAINIVEDSSPVSFLDRSQFLGGPETPTSGLDVFSISCFSFQLVEDDSVSTGLDPRSKLSMKLENYEHPCPRKDNSFVSDGDELISKAKEISYEGEGSRELHKRSQREMWEIIRRLTEAEMVGSRRSRGEFQSLGAEIQWIMLQELIDDLVHQLHVPIKDFQ